MVLLMAGAFVFGSTKHSDLTGSEEGKVKEFMGEFVKEEPFAGSVLVLHKGEVILNESYGLADKENKVPFTKDLQFPVRSIAKWMKRWRSTVGGRRKAIVTDRLSEYMPELPHANQITLHQLLNHS